MHKRGNREGTIRKRGNSWQVSVMLGRKPTGERRTKSFSSSTRAGALKKMHDYMQAIENGIEDSDHTVDSWMQIYLKLHSVNIKPVTIENYKYTARLISRHIGEIKLKKLLPIHVEEMLIKLREEGRSDSAIAQAKGLLYGAIHKAVGNNLISRNVVAYAPRLRRRNEKIEKEIYSVDECRHIISYLLSQPGTKKSHSIVLLLTCGCRTQELLGLTPAHISETGDMLFIRQAVSMEKGHPKISSCKSRDSIRDTAIPAIARESVLFLRNTQDQLVWESPIVPGQPVNPSYFRRLYRDCMESIPGIKYLPPHNLRHTYISLLASQNVNTPLLMKIAGHSDQRMTVLYSHPYQEAKIEVAEKLSVLLGDGEKQ